jgi:hypothetical protein
VLAGVDAGQRKLDQKLGLRPRDQNVGRHFEIETVKLAPAGEICDRLAVAPSSGQRVECPRLLCRHRLVAMRAKPGAIAAQHMSQQNLSLERNEAAGSKRARYGRR